jgi:SAM-dependent methyltransferase
MPNRYWAADHDAVTERRRLELLEARYDPLSARRLDALGVSRGWSCLEVAAGAGSVARLLAERGGPAGRVVATDVDPRFLDGPLPPNVEVRRHDILSDSLDEGVFDLVHCRALLCHLDNPTAALDHMASALRRGGWLLVEDADYITLETACPNHPAHPAWTRIAERLRQPSVLDGVMDPRLGRDLPGLLAELGLHDRGQEGTVRIHPGASPAADFLACSLRANRKRLVQAGAASEVDLDEVLASLADPAFAFVDSVSYAAWGRRP